MKLSQLKEFIKTVVKEEQDYEELFQSMLAKTGKNIPDMSDDEKKKFFNDVDDSYKAKSESKIRGYSKSVNESNLSWKEMDRYANAISNLTGTRANAVKKFIEDNDLDAEEIFKLVNKGGLVERVRFIKALSGTPGNTTAKWFVKTFQNESVRKGVVNEGKFKKDDLVYNKRTKTVGIVRIGDDKHGEVKTDADGNVDVDELEKYNPIKFKHQSNAKVAPSTEKEVNSRGLFNPFKNESVRKGVVKEAAFRTLFTHPIWKKAGVNYVDSKFVNDCKNKIPLSDLVHLGMGDFMLKTPHGNISFDRVSYQFDGMSGRAHKMTGNKELMDMLIKAMRAQVVHSESVNKSIKTSINEWSSNDVLALLGGKRFLATSGAYAMSGNVAQKTAKFNFKTPGKNGINNVWITETSPDTYTINFIKVEGEDVNVSPIKNVSGDKLKSIFTKYTGLKTP